MAVRAASKATRCGSIQAMFRSAAITLALSFALSAGSALWAQTSAPAGNVTVLHAAHMFDVEHGALISPGEVLVRGDRIVEAGRSVSRPAGARGARPGGEGGDARAYRRPRASLSSSRRRRSPDHSSESVPERTILARNRRAQRPDGRLHRGARRWERKVQAR